MPTDTQTSKFPIPFTLDEFRQDILEVVLHYMRAYAFMTGSDENKVPGAFGIDPEGIDCRAFYLAGGAERSAVEIGLRYESLKGMTLVQTLERMYEFAYKGLIDSGFEPMEDDTSFSFVSALVVDAHESWLAHEGFERGSNASQAVYRCRQVAELAAARNVLEGGEDFFPYFSPAIKGHFDNCLIIRQMAVLAGMEEMSIRAAANPKRANPLKTYTEGKNTCIAIADAKAWLQSKGLYVPITYHFKDTFFDMRTRSFNNSFELITVLKDRFKDLAKKSSEQTILDRMSPDLAAKFKTRSIEHTTLEDQELLGQIADALELPSTLLTLRAQQVLAKDRLNEIDWLLKDEIAKA